jgi:hypothetical protein
MSHLMRLDWRLSLCVFGMCGLLAAQDPPPREAPPPVPPAPPAQNAVPAQQPAQQNVPPPNVPPPPPDAPQLMELPPGTPIHVRTIEAIDSRTAGVNREYAASLSESLMVNGLVVAPRNADVRLRVVEDKKAGAVSGRTTLVLQISAIRMNGQLVNVDTGSSVKESGSQGAKTATRGIVGGLLGAGIGAMAGGGKGAAIGAGAGSAVGVASAMISGEEVRVKPETRLDFSLSTPAQVPAPQPGAPPPAVDYPQSAPPPPSGRAETTLRTGGWVVTVQSCFVDGGRMSCNLSIANANGRREREVSILGDSTLVDMDGNRQRTVAICVGNGRCSPDWANARVFPGNAVNVRLDFGPVSFARPVDRLKVMLRWQGGEEALDFRGFRVDGFR